MFIELPEEGITIQMPGKEALKMVESAKKSDRKAVTLYLSEKTYKNFKKVCGKASASLVIEQLMSEFAKMASLSRK